MADLPLRSFVAAVEEAVTRGPAFYRSDLSRLADYCRVLGIRTPRIAVQIQNGDSAVTFWNDLTVRTPLLRRLALAGSSIRLGDRELNAAETIKYLNWRDQTDGD